MAYLIKPIKGKSVFDKETLNLICNMFQYAKDMKTPLQIALSNKGDRVVFRADDGKSFHISCDFLLADYTNDYQQQLKSVTNGNESVTVTLKILEILMKDANPNGFQCTPMTMDEFNAIPDH